MTEIYVTEPDVIDMEAAAGILPSGDFTLTRGTANFKAEFVSDAEVLLIRSGTTVGSDIKRYFPCLQAVIRVGTGLDNVDTDYCAAAGVAVFNAPGANANAVAEYVTAMILYVRRGLNRLNHEDVAAWNRFVFRGEGVASQTVGIVGFGHIGRLLQQKLAGLGCKDFLVFDPYLPVEAITRAGAVPVELDALLGGSDIVSLHLPLLPETRHIIDAEKLALLKDGALLINAARGGIVDESALLAVGEKLTYVADTVEGEPQVNPALIARSNVIVTPHIASLTAESEEAMLRMAVTNYLESTNSL